MLLPKTLPSAYGMAEALNTLRGMRRLLEFIAKGLCLHDREDLTFRFAEICDELGTNVTYYQGATVSSLSGNSPYLGIPPEDALQLACVCGDVLDYFSGLERAMNQLRVLCREIDAGDIALTGVSTCSHPNHCAQY